MKKLELENFEVQEMSLKELSKENGGFWLEVAELAIGVASLGYQIGKDLAAYDKRH
ncbi:hypothetical protein G6M26_42200 [Agrobacterium tumefaciens]|nr:hypothetical protein [Agrobacterium tumefaciens]NTE25159.1 hypothetical protein [Agrobacterium tumefaciens]